MAGLKPIDLTDLNAAVTEAIGVFASVNAYIDGVAAKIAAAVNVAVAAALVADNTNDQLVLDAAQGAIRDTAAALKAEAEKTAAALVANQPPTQPPTT